MYKRQDLHHYRDEFRSPAAVNDGWMVTRSVDVAQLDGDPQLEYVLNDSRLYSGKVSAFDGIDHDRQWTSAIWDGEYVNIVQAGDLNGDGAPEVLVGTGREHTGADGAFVRVLRGTDGGELWRSLPLPSDWSGVTEISIADVDGDATLSLIHI